MPECAVFSQTILPVSRFKQITFQWCFPVGGDLRSPPKYNPLRATHALPSVNTVVINTCFPHTTGEDQPRPGMSCFHTIFSVVLQRSGRSACSATPIASGPRNCGQLSTAPTLPTTATIKSEFRSFMICYGDGAKSVAVTCR